MSGGSAKINTIYFWWWTPWVLREKQLDKIFTAIKVNYTFTKNIEITLEVTPDTVSKESVELWKKVWINRISMWVQTLNSKSLEVIWRGSKGDIEAALKILKEAHLEKISMSVDFIIWLPYVKKWEIVANIEYLLKNYGFITHISVYMLEDYYNADKIIETKYDNITYPENWWKLWLHEDQYLEEYVDVKKFLEEKWFFRYEISNFAKKWYECTHNQWYWSHKEVKAFWLWAYWYVDWVRYANSENFTQYYAGKKIYESELTQKDIFIEKMMFQLRTTWLRKNVYSQLNQEKITELLQEKFLIKKSDRIILSDKWVLVMDTILSQIY
jgi:oxygen-independent coproporphyrinogen-3 oxidase